MAKFFIITGIVFIIIGLFWPFLAKLPLGRLPGDIFIQKKNVTFYFPLATSILASIVLSLIVWLLTKR
jgi:hypothetical protein